MLFAYKRDEQSMLVILYSSGNRPNTIITMMVLELMYIFTWIISIMILLAWYYIRSQDSPYNIENDKEDGHPFWIDKNCDDYLRFQQR